MASTENAERYEVLIDFSRYPAGRRVELRNLSNEQPRLRRHRQDHGVRRDRRAGLYLGTRRGNRFDDTVDGLAMRLTSGQATRTRRMRLHRDDVTNEWMINGVTWHDVVDSGFRLSFADVALNDVEIWRLRTAVAGGSTRCMSTSSTSRS